MKRVHWIRNGRTPGLTAPRAMPLLTIAIWLAATGSASAAMWRVTSLGDSGAGSLRQVVFDAGEGDTIVFDVSGTILLLSGQLILPKSLMLLGPGSSALVISGNKAARIFYVSTSGSVTLSSLTIADGRAAEGGGIYNASGTLVLYDCSLS